MAQELEKIVCSHTGKCPARIVLRHLARAPSVNAVGCKTHLMSVISDYVRTGVAKLNILINWVEF